MLEHDWERFNGEYSGFVYMIGNDLFIVNKNWLGKTYITTQENEDYLKFPLEPDEHCILSILLNNSEYIGML